MFRPYALAIFLLHTCSHSNVGCVQLIYAFLGYGHTPICFLGDPPVSLLHTTVAGAQDYLLPSVSAGVDLVPEAAVPVSCSKGASLSYWKVISEIKMVHFPYALALLGSR